jgi:hypothetical protein
MTNKRKKASDIFNETNFVFSQKVPFNQAFPEIEDIKIAVKEKGYGVTPGLGTHIYLSGREYSDCSNPACYNGGISLGSIIRTMVQDKETHIEKSCFCQGYEGSPKGRRRYQCCPGKIHYQKLC